MELQRVATNVIHKWCNRWNIPEPIIVEDSDIGLGYQESDDDKYIIGINPERTQPHMNLTILLHELRHHYQSIKYPEFYAWWSDNIHLYEFFYKSPICVLEEDANIFSWTNGKKDGAILFSVVNQDYVNQAYKEIINREKTFQEYYNEIQKIEIAHGISDWRSYQRQTLTRSKWNYEYILFPSK